MTELKPMGGRVSLGSGVHVTSPGLKGQAEVLGLGAPNLRGADRATAAYEAALQTMGLAEQLTIVIRDTAEVPAPGTHGLRSPATGEDAFEVEVPAPSEGFAQLMLVVDEGGAATWVLPEAREDASGQARGTGSAHFLVRKRVPRGQPTGTSRGIFGVLGRKILKVLVFKVVEVVSAGVGEFFIRRWESKHRGYGIRSFTPDDYAAGGTPVAGADWKRLAEGRGLLFVHGTFSRAHLAFSALPRAAFLQLFERYGGRVFAFDHPTMTATPTANAKHLLAAVPEGTRLDLDVVAHSRGGLVSRVLAQGDSASPCSVRRLLHVAVPNAGTPLTNPEHMGTFIDTYTNLLSFFPDNGVTEVLESLIALLKHVALGVLGGLDGLQAMNPSGAWLQALNQPGPLSADYRAIASNFEPRQMGLSEFVKDRVMDAVFDGASNDLVVPTGGVFGANGGAGFPIAGALEVPEDEGVAHNGFFANERVATQLLEWLPG